MRHIIIILASLFIAYVIMQKSGVNLGFGNSENTPLQEKVAYTLQDLNVGNKTIVGSNIAFKTESVDELPRGYITEEIFNSYHKNSLTRKFLPKGTFLTRSDLINATEGKFLSSRLDSNMRAISLRIDKNSGTTGFIMPGDKVDLVVTYKIKYEQERRFGSKEQTRNVSETFVRNALVLAVDKTTEKDFDDKNKSFEIMTLQVSPGQAEKISLAREMGKVIPILKSSHKHDSHTGQTVTIDANAFLGLGLGVPKKAPPPAQHDDNPDQIPQPPSNGTGGCQGTMVDIKISTQNDENTKQICK